METNQALFKSIWDKFILSIQSHIFKKETIKFVCFIIAQLMTNN